MAAITAVKLRAHHTLTDSFAAGCRRSSTSSVAMVPSARNWLSSDDMIAATMPAVSTAPVTGVLNF
jgi:hypothetical protein